MWAIPTYNSNHPVDLVGYPLAGDFSYSSRASALPTNVYSRDKIWTSRPGHVGRLSPNAPLGVVGLSARDEFLPIILPAGAFPLTTILCHG